MADNVPVTPSASYTVWAEDFASSGVIQRVKVVLGAPDADGGNVGTTNPMPVSGAVSVSAMPAVSISVSAVLGTVVTVLGTQVVSVVPGVSVNALVTGPVSVSAMPAVSISVSAVLGTVVTVLGTVAVNVVAGGAAPGTTAATQSAISAQVVWLAPTQTISVVSTIATLLGTVAVNVVAGGAAPGTTAATQSAISAQVVWLAPTQTMTATVNTIAAGFSVNALVTGVVSVSVLPAVSISAVVPVTTAASVSVTGLPVWMNPTQQVVVSGLVGHSITGSVNIVSVALVSITASAIVGTIIAVSGVTAVSAISTIVTILGTQIVSVALLNFTTATPTVTATGPIVWLANTVTVTVTATVTGSLIISAIAPVTTAASVSVSGLPVWLNPTQGVVASVSALAASVVLGTIIAVSGVTAISAVSTIVTVLGTAIVTQVGSPGFNAVHIEITSTAIAQSAAAYLFTIWTGATGAPVAAGTTAFAVPAGKTLRLLNMQGIINSSAVTGGTVNIIVVGAGATASHVSASISTQLQVMKLQVLVSAGPVAASIMGFQDVPPAVSIAMFIVASTAAQLQQMVIHGYLF